MEKLLVNKQLYPFQRDAIIELNNFYQNEKNPKGYLHIATGGGKTLVSNYFLVKNYLLKNKKVLWLAWDWNLLAQAKSVLESEFKNKFQAAYIANSKNNQNKVLTNNTPEFDETYSDKRNVQIIYSTVQTFSSKTSLTNFVPDIVVIDEAHHGKSGIKERDIFEYIKKYKIPVIGLSGTPKARRGWKYAYSISFKELMDQGYLVRGAL